MEKNPSGYSIRGGTLFIPMKDTQWSIKLDTSRLVLIVGPNFWFCALQTYMEIYEIKF